MIRFFLALLATAISVSAAPNIILIYTDDQGFGDASCLNPEARFQ
ncbi:MAG: arylsulfatase A, partial [Verrucomicrobiales bacterium]